MAEKDVGQLSQVHVSGLTGSLSLDLPVSTVSRQESTVGQSPAAVFVITNEMIRRSGAKCIPEVLRMVPGLEVAKINSNTWAISSRGFNGRFANNLLVQIDGRVVYNELFGGVFWDVQDVLLEDVERIEVIRGPGATVWGANAVNGVINIITKSAKDTQGVYFENGAGSYEEGFSSVRYGGRVGDDLCYRVYGKWFERGDGYLPYMDATDAWRQVHGGFRMDWRPDADDTITCQGDYYNGYDGDEGYFAQLTNPYIVMERNVTHVAGDNVLVNWRRVLDERSDWTAKVYYDQTHRHWQDYGLGDDENTLDFDFQYRFPLGARNEVICGTEYRNVFDSTYSATPSSSLNILPPEQTTNLYSCFVQDQFTVKDDFCFLTVGSKFERNDYTGFEFEPSIRLLVTPNNKYSMWAAVSRAVRTPTRGEEGAQALGLPFTLSPPTFPFVTGNTNLLSEELLAYEAGVRGQPTENFSWDLAVFLNDYNRLITAVPETLASDGLKTRPQDVVIIPMIMSNVARGDTYGFELAATYKATPSWQLRAAYTFLIMDLQPLLETNQPEMWEGESPHNEVYLQSSFDLGRHWELDLICRYVDNLPTIGVSKYIVGDVRLAWHPNKNLELSVVGRNLCNGKFYEYANDENLGSIATEVSPEVYGQVAWRY